MTDRIWEFHALMIMHRLVPHAVSIATASLALLLVAAQANASPRPRHAVIFYTGETHGVLEPCGCTSDPLGDFARVTALVRAAAGKHHDALLVDAGNLSYPLGRLSPKKAAAAKLQASFLARETGRLPFGGSALGECDLAAGPEQVTPKRLAVNAEPAAFVEPSRIVDTGGIKIGVLGIVDPQVAKQAGLAASKPGPAAAQEVTRLRGEGAEIVVLLAPVERAFARTLARTSGADIVVIGKNLGKGMARAERVGKAFLVAPGDELQYVGRLDIVLRGPAPRKADDALEDAGSPEQAKERLQEIDRDLSRLNADLVRWEKDPSADAAFVASKQRKREELIAERAKLATSKWQAPTSGSYLTNVLIPVRRSLPRDRALRASLRKLDRAVGAANLAQAEPPPAPEPGRAFYVGAAKCTSCHKASDRQWRRTPHAHAWKTLVKVGKQNHDDCVSCHVTGYGEVGGSSLGHTRGLRDVQCEVCHEPNSIHVEKRGKESPYAGSLGTPEKVCVRCHNEKHSDTFQYEPYLRDALGPGHGELLLDKIGPGTTARQLRRAGAAAAKRGKH